jgi:hypothetical protein
MADDDPDAPGSTLIQTGKAALTFSEMAAFVHDIEARPIERLIADLVGLMALPEAKYNLVVMVLRKKVRPGGAERQPILARLRQLRAAAEDPAVRSRAEAFLARPHD